MAISNLFELFRSVLTGVSQDTIRAIHDEFEAIRVAYDPLLPALRVNFPDGTLPGDVLEDGSVSISKLEQQLQSALGMQPFYNLDGLTGNITNANVPDVTGDFTVIVPAKNKLAQTVTTQDLMTRHTAAGDQQGFYFRFDADGRLRLYVSPTGNGAGQASVVSGDPITDADEINVYACAFSASTFMQIYKNSQLIGELTSGVPASLFATTANVIAGARLGGGYFAGDIYGKPMVFNKALTVDEIASLSAGEPIEFKYSKATGLEATSGTLLVGKAYTITDFQAGDDFVNVGAASNANGVEFVATGTTPTTWTNSSGVTSTGNVLNMDSFGETQTLDSDHPEIIGTVTGATLENEALYHYSQHRITASDDTGPLSIWKEDHELVEIIAVETSGNAATINYGTTVSGNEIYPAGPAAILASPGQPTVIHVTLVDRANKDVYIDFVTGGGVATVEFTFVFRKIR